MQSCVLQPDFLEKFFLAQKLGKWTQNEPKTGVFFEFLENLVIKFYWIWSIMKIYIICCVATQISYWWKSLFLRYGPKCSLPIKLQDFLFNHISRTNQWNSLFFLYVDTNSHKLKVDQKIWEWALSENELMEWTGFLHAGADSGKLKVVSIIFGWMWSKLGVVMRR